MIKKYSLYRPKDIAIHALVSDNNESKTFYLVQNDVLSTTESILLESYQNEGLEIKKTTLAAQTLTEILENHPIPKEFDLLSIDAEEHDFEVLKGFDWEKYQPKLVVVEDETFDWNIPNTNQIYQLMTKNGYKIEGFVLKNLYFLKVG